MIAWLIRSGRLLERRDSAEAIPALRMPVNRGAPRTMMRQFIFLLRPYARPMSLCLLMLITLAVFNMLMPAYFIKLLVDDVFGTSNWSLLWGILFGILGVYLARNILYFISKFTAVSVGEDLCFALRKRLFGHLQQKSMQFYRENRAGKLSSRVMDDSYVIQQFIQDELPTLLQASFLFIGLTGVIFWLNWQLALACTMVFPLHLLAFNYFRRPIKDASRIAQEQKAVVYGNLIEKFLGVEVVKGFNAEGRESQTFHNAIDISRKSQLKGQFYHLSQKIVADLLVGLGTIGLLGFGAFQVMERGMKPGAFLAFFSMVVKLYPTVLELMSGCAKLTRANTSVDRVFDMLESDQLESSSKTPMRKRIVGDIEFDAVRFHYRNFPAVLKNVGFKVPAGKVCAIVGPSGAGKSTLVNLVPRFIDTCSGSVKIDNIDIREFDLDHLRKYISIAGQEAVLFNTSILENLRYAKPDATMDEIVEAARRSGAHEFITRLPKSYATRLGEDGHNLSRGEMQRIALTRAMLKQPQILILDEATASLDRASQSEIIPAVLECMRGRTVLMVTHDPRTLMMADMVVALDEGRVVYNGPPRGIVTDLYRQGRVSMGDAKPPVVNVKLPENYQFGSASDQSPWKQTLKAGMIALMLLVGLSASAANAQEEPAKEEAPKAEAPQEATPAAEVVEPPKPQPAARPTPGRFIAQPGLGDVEVEELVDVLHIQAQTEMGYKTAAEGDPNAPASDALMDKLTMLPLLVRETPAGKHYMMIGYRFFRSQPPHIYISGHILQAGEQTMNQDVTTIAAMLEQGREALDTQNASLQLADLVTKKIRLSYSDPQRALTTLKAFGYTVVEPGTVVDSTKLPVITTMPATSGHGLPAPKDAAGKPADFPLTDADPVSDLIVFYHPAKPEQYADVYTRVKEVIDLPARQIMIEALVLEISETGLKKLGVEWELQTPRNNIGSLKLGRLPAFAQATGEAPTLDLSVENIFGEFQADIQALIREGSAEVLSRPSVLTLDNRMAFIDVSERIPVVNAINNPRSDIVTVSFKEVTAGISLNVRPRISDDGRDISMQVNASVTARVPNEDVIVRNSEGDEVARSPTISAREVRTYTRIGNNTPFIIGGLVSKDETSDIDKVPLLGDLPLIGGAFRSERKTKEKREVIIVITPFVLPDSAIVKRNLPRDEDAFDSFGLQLFHDAYRIRAEDVFELKFLLDNKQLLAMKEMANAAASRNRRLADQYPFSEFVDQHVPGEEYLVLRQMYEVVKRLDAHERVNDQRIIFFTSDPAKDQGVQVAFLNDLLAEVTGGPPAKKEELGDLFAKMPDKAIAITYTVRDKEGIHSALKQPVPEVRLVDCASRIEWAQKLWELNQPTDQGQQRRTIVLHEGKDLLRLRRAIMLSKVVELNATDGDLSLERFSIGQLLLIPSGKEEKVYLMDDEVARLFFITEHYYPALQKKLEDDADALRRALNMPDVSRRMRQWENRRPTDIAEMRPEE